MAGSIWDQILADDTRSIFNSLFPGQSYTDWVSNVNIEADPLSIIYDPSRNYVEAFTAYINTYGIVTLLRQMIIFGAFISFLITLIIILFVKNSETLKEKKTELVYKVGIVFTASLSVFIFTVVKNFFDGLFGMI